MGVEQTLIILDKLNILKIADIFSLGFRWLGWKIIQLLARIINSIEDSVTKIYSINGFFNSQEMNQFINKYKPLIFIILAISITVIGIRIMFNKKQNRSQIPSNLIFSICVVVLLPIFMIKLNQMTTIAVDDLTGKYTSSANELIKNNLYDLYYLDKNNYNLTGPKNNIPADNITNLDINEKLDTKNIEEKNKKIFEKKVKRGNDGSIKLEKLDDGWFFSEEYYRYSVDFITVILSLSATGVTLVCVALKIARLIFELAFNKMFATLFAFADIDDGKKIREIIKHIGSIFAVLFTMAVMLKLYILFNSWLGSTSNANALDGMTKIIVLIGVSIAVIDGPNIVERIFGIDAGLKNAWGAVIGGYSAAKGGAALAKGAAKAGKGLATASAIGTAGAIGAANGARYSRNNGSINNSSDIDSKNKTLQDEMQENKSNKNNSSSANSNINKEDSTNMNNKNNVSDTKGNSGNIKNKTLQEEMNQSKVSNSSNDVNSKNSNSNNPDNKQNGISNIGANINSNTNSKNSTLHEEMANKPNNSNIKSKNTTLQEEMKSNTANLNKGIQRPKEGVKATLQDQMKNNSPNKLTGLNNKQVQQPNLHEQMKGESDINSKKANKADIGSVASGLNNKNTQQPNLHNQMKDSKNSINDGKSKVDGGAILNDISNKKDFNQPSLNNEMKDSSNKLNNMKNKDVEIPNLNEQINNKKVGQDNNIKVPGTLETRTIGEYVKDRVTKPDSFYDKITRAYNLGKNTTSNINKRKGDKK
ncbi:pLS20_p028 family conjugation system transmembrane protein [Clostridium faecium]|uniref:DUF8208 domain-containing protein n=1 Tax=Clostridium faecium TaxID=2762223 RepID=A0ABR8YNR6_9CLOT|nr:hypothetical protein [Clostridium faecium]MBD8045859.1 hypothetical protein [Clostridium faecium]